MKLLLGDCLELMAELEEASVDAVVTDPPYSSGGVMRSDRTLSVHTKYVQSDSIAGHRLSPFSGDNRDQRGYGYWSTLWLTRCFDVLKDGGVVAVFTDWRQLPITTDVIQAGGFVWRGIVPWAKPSCRPSAGRFAAQCEYVVWGSKGGMPVDYEAACLPGFYEASTPSNREHIAQKPVGVLRSIVRICPKGGTVLDPFMGSGTTGVACAEEGRDFIGIERDRDHLETAVRRIALAQDTQRLPLDV